MIQKLWESDEYKGLLEINRVANGVLTVIQDRVRFFCKEQE